MAPATTTSVKAIRKPTTPASDPTTGGPTRNPRYPTLEAAAIAAPAPPGLLRAAAPNMRAIILEVPKPAISKPISARGCCRRLFQKEWLRDELSLFLCKTRLPVNLSRQNLPRHLSRSTPRLYHSSHSVYGSGRRGRDDANRRPEIGSQEHIGQLAHSAPPLVLLQEARNSQRAPCGEPSGTPGSRIERERGRISRQAFHRAGIHSPIFSDGRWHHRL